MENLFSKLGRKLRIPISKERVFKVTNQERYNAIPPEIKVYLVKLQNGEIDETEFINHIEPICYLLGVTVSEIVDSIVYSYGSSGRAGLSGGQTAAGPRGVPSARGGRNESAREKPGHPRGAVPGPVSGSRGRRVR